MASITPSGISTQGSSASGSAGSVIRVVPDRSIQNFRPISVISVNGTNAILGEATLFNGKNSEKVSVLAVANGNSGQYLYVPPNSSAEQVLRNYTNAKL